MDGKIKTGRVDEFGEYHSPNIAFAAAAGGGGQNSYAALYAQNMQVRNLIVHGIPANGIPPAVDMWQPINPGLPNNPQPGSVLTCQLRNVGLIKRLIVKITAQVTPSAQNQTLTALGLANLVSNITFTDLANNQRINTSGWHLVAVATAKRRRVWGAALTTDTPLGYGNNFSTISAPAALVGGAGASNVTLFLEVPFVRNDHDLRGMIMGAVATATMQMTLTLNPTMFVASGADATLAVYQSAGAGVCTLSNVAWQVYQNYLDQYPRQQNGAPILPALDIGTAYVLNNVSSALPVANQDNAFPFVNQRQFLSTVAIYDNAGTLNVGSDIANWKITSANFTNILLTDPVMQSLIGRVRIGDDFPKGMYYFDFNDRPIDTSIFGNMQLILNPSNVGGATAVVLLGYEAYGIIGQINQGGSIPSGA